MFLPVINLFLNLLSQLCDVKKTKKQFNLKYGVGKETS